MYEMIIFWHILISFIHDFHFDGETMIVRTRKCQYISSNVFDFTAQKFLRGEGLSKFKDHILNN